MEYTELAPLYASYHNKLSENIPEFVRYLHDKINWDSRIIGIKGARGVGKTTLLKQHIKSTFANPDETLYVSMDDIWFSTHSLMNLVEYLYTHGIKHIFIDEVHRCPDWMQIFKNIYDNYPGFNIVYTSSSMLEIDHSKFDLSRRQVVYNLERMSFREFLAVEGLLNIEPVTLEEILSSHVSMAMEITSKVKILLAFENYLKYGCYPFYKNSINNFFINLKDTVTAVIDSDMPATEKFEYDTLQKAKKLLAIIAEMVPFVPNMKTLYEQLETDRNLGLKLLYSLEKAGLLNLVSTTKKSYKNLAKPDKILLGDPNLMYALCQNPEIGTVRETFFAMALQAVASVMTPVAGDFLIDEKYMFEVGGKKKSFEQIRDLPNSYVAADSVETGFANRIPLWMFGLMY